MRDFIDDIARSIGFLSRIPVPNRFFAEYDGSLSRAVRAFPVAGILIALPSAILAALLTGMHANPLFSAVLVIASQIVLSGALHEDGLADAVDGLAGGRTRERRLEIMRDSRIGTYGAIALLISFTLRVSALSAIMPVFTPLGIGLTLLAIAAFSRGALVAHWSSLMPARLDGVAASVGTPDTSAAQISLLISIPIAAMLVWISAGLMTSLSVLVIAGMASWLFTVYVKGKIGGHTGDTLGASQQCAELAMWAALALVT